MVKSKSPLYFTVIVFFLIPICVHSGTIEINSTDDNNSRDNVITLREAIMLSEGSLLYGDLTVNEQSQIIPPVGSGISDTINFAVSGTITPTSALPEIVDDGTVIDASFQWIGVWPEGWPGITIDGSGGSSMSGLDIFGSNNCHIRGLFITNFKYNGISIYGGGKLNTIGGAGVGYRNVMSGNSWSGVFISGPGTDSNVVSGNYIGTDVSGDATLGNTANGVAISDGAKSNTIGGATESDRNIISGNGEQGVSIYGSDTDGNLVSGNYIGTDVTGTATPGSESGGVVISGGSKSNTIGGTTEGERNIISGNKSYGVSISGLGTNSNVISGNYIGTDVNGTSDLGNGYVGVIISNGTQYNTIGGNTEGARNIISGNDDDGIFIFDPGTDNNTVSGNYIGTDVNGIADLGNKENGVLIRDGGHNNTVGGTTPGERNIISGNDGYGITIRGPGTWNNIVSGNYIGTDVNGIADLGNSASGVLIREGAQSNIIGGTTPGERNIISGNDDGGLSLKGLGTQNNKVCGNYIGTDVNGTANLENSDDGVAINEGAKSNIIGGTSPGERNIISGNDGNGVDIDHSGTENNIVSGNYIGTDVTGTVPLGNDGGVIIEKGAASNTIGGMTEAEGNIISGNNGVGVIIRSLGSDNNMVLGNYIGTDVDGTTDLGNSGDGVYISEGSDEWEGGARSNTIAQNAIAYNEQNGVRVEGTDTDFNTISRNSMHDNGDNEDLGIDLVDGGNDEIDAPDINCSQLLGNTLTISGSDAGPGGVVEVFLADSFESGEGCTYLGTLTAEPNGDFSGSIDVTEKGLSPDDPIVATSTHPNGNTSEFSSPLPQIVVNPTRLVYTAIPGGTNPDPKILSITNPACGMLCWDISISFDATWLSCSPTSDCTTDETDEVTVSVEITDLSEGEHNATITITATGASNSPQVVTVTLYLLYAQFFDHEMTVAGWHLISFPLELTDPYPGAALSSIADKYNSIWAYDPGEGWSIYAPTGPSDLTELRPGKGYWLKMDVPGTLSVQGIYPPDPVEIDLKGGVWNLVGYNSLDEKNTETCMSNVANDINSVWKYTPVEGWSIYVPGGVSDLDIMGPGFGFWIKADNNCTWDVNTP